MDIERTLLSANRRAWLACTGGLLAAASTPARASVLEWWPYRSDQMRRIDPVITDFAADEATTAVLTGRRSSLASPLALQPPRAYARIGQQFGVNPWLLYGVALQESQLKFGERTLPYPWTLCVRGRGLRFGGYETTLQALRGYVGRQVTNVDCGAMQVNWHWHGDKLGSFERALDPYPNLAVGARILRGHYDARGSWRKAIALYHTGSDTTAETRERGNRYATQTLARLERMGAIRSEGRLRHG